MLMTAEMHAYQRHTRLRFIRFMNDAGIPHNPVLLNVAAYLMHQYCFSCIDQMKGSGLCCVRKASWHSSHDDSI